MQRASALISTLFGLAVALAIASLGFSAMDEDALAEVHAKHFRIVPGNVFLLSRHTAGVPAELSRDAQAINEGTLQVSVRWENPDSTKPSAILATGLAPGTRLFANGVPIGDASALGFRPIGFAGHWAFARIDTSNHVTGLERLDLVLPEGTEAIESLRMWATDSGSAASLRAEFEASMDLLKRAIQFAATIGLVAAGLGLILSRDLVSFAGGGAIAASQLAKTWQGGPWGTLAALDPLIVAVCLAGLVLMALGRPGSGKSLRGFIRGLVLCGILGIAISIWALLGPAAFRPSIGQLYFANLASVPALGIGLPLLLGLAVRESVSSLISARRAVAQRDAIIDEQQAEIEAKVRKQAVLEERQRFVRDMHDGVGGQLLSLLMKVRGRSVALGDVEIEIERSIADLRLVVDSLDQVGSDLATALESFRGRTSVQLSGGGIVFDWQEEGPISDWTFGAREVLSIYRVMQESIGNAVRHARATAIAVNISAGCPQHGRLRIEISDDGQGFDVDAVQAGRGLGNMRNRALRLGGELSVDSVPGKGTRIALSLPADQ